MTWKSLGNHLYRLDVPGGYVLRHEVCALGQIEPLEWAARGGLKGPEEDLSCGD